jgi:hypothetical protein
MGAASALTECDSGFNICDIVEWWRAQQHQVFSEVVRASVGDAIL